MAAFTEKYGGVAKKTYEDVMRDDSIDAVVLTTGQEFHRNISLPCEVEGGNIKADFKDGILRINMQKKPEAQRKTKKIEIKT